MRLGFSVVLMEKLRPKSRRRAVNLTEGWGDGVGQSVAPGKGISVGFMSWPQGVGRRMLTSHLGWNNAAPALAAQLQDNTR